jgi:tetratricopeptide (TPR) repeat protein
MESFQTQLQFYQDNIEEDSNDHGAYYGIGITYVKMGEETGDASYYAKAVAEFNKAIHLKSDNPLYYADRSKAYILINW